MENNHFSLPSGLHDYGQTVASWNQYAVDNTLTPKQTQAGLDKLVKGDMPEYANVTKAIVEGYTDGVLALGAWHIGTAAKMGKVVAGSSIGSIANGSYQWFDITQSGNENKAYNFVSTGAAAIMEGLAPGRGVWQNVGIAAGGAVFTDGPDIGSVGTAAAGAWLGGKFVRYAPGIVNSITEKEVPGFIYGLC